MDRKPPLLEVRDLTVSVGLPEGGRAKVVRDVSFSIEAGETLGLVGESGSGKTMASLAIMGLLPPAARVDSGQILLDGEDLCQMGPRALRTLRGKQMSMVLQDSLTALDPSFTIGNQLAEPLRQHRAVGGRDLDKALVESLEQVQLSADRLREYPHRLSGGMRQRATSAIALAGIPRLLIADEPTTALDVTTQARFLQMLRDLQKTTGFALVLIAHDLMIVRHVCQRVLVMYAGEVVEKGEVEDLFLSARHPYTRALIESMPVLGEAVRMEAIEGQAPDPIDEIAGCRFAPRCKFARDVCRSTPPELSDCAPAGVVRCWGAKPGGWIDASQQPGRTVASELGVP
ncbi:MAG: ABC transporter ATP-binding protein, partial [bacterium]